MDVNRKEIWMVTKYGVPVLKTEHKIARENVEVTGYMFDGKSYLEVVVNGTVVYFQNITEF